MYTKKYNSAIFNEPTYNENALDIYSYSNNITDPISTKENMYSRQELEVPTEDAVEYILLTSRERNRSLYPNPAKYTLRLPAPIRMVTGVQVLSGTFPVGHGIEGSPIVVLDIKELNDIRMFSLEKSATAILQLKSGVNASFNNIDVGNNVPISYATPKDRVENLTVSLKDQVGNVFNLGTESSSGNVNEAIQWTVLLEVKFKRVKPMKSQRH